MRASNAVRVGVILLAAALGGLGWLLYESGPGRPRPTPLVTSADERALSPPAKPEAPAPRAQDEPAASAVGLAGPPRAPALRGIALAWATTNLPGAFAWANSLPDPKDRYNALSWVISRWAAQDMTAALDYVRALPASERTRLVQHAASLLSNETPATVAALISTLPQSAAQTEVISRFSGDFCRAEPGAAMDWIKSLPEGGAREAALGDASARALAQYDPRTAADFAGGLPPGSGRSQFLSVALDEWFRSDARSATDWLTGWLKANSNPGDGSGNGDLLSRLGNRWGKTDPQAALNFAQGLVPNQQHPFLMEAGAAWAMTDSKAALDAVGRLPEGPARDSFLLGLAGGLAQVAPEQAAHVVSSLVQPGNQQIAAQSVVRQWVKTDPQAAAAWVANFPENMRREAVTIVADSWAAHDPKAVGQWLGSLPAGHSVDRAIANYIDRTGRKFPALAAPLVGRISDAADRERYVETLATAWLRTDPAAAQAWLAQTGLPSERQQQLLKRR